MKGLSPSVMPKDFEGTFSANFFSLQLQLKTLLEDCGGDGALQLLDSLADLNESEKPVVLGVFSRVLKRLLNGEKRITTSTDAERKEFEDGLYREIMAALHEATHPEGTGKLSVIRGGKPPPGANTPIDLGAARKARKPGTKPSIN